MRALIGVAGWALLLCVVPRPSYPAATAATGPRVQRDTQPVRAMYERETAHAVATRTVRRTLRDSAPLAGAGDAFNPSAYSMHSPPAQSSAASSHFSAAPRVSSHPSSAE